MDKINCNSIINNVIEQTDESKVENIIKYILSDDNAENHLKNLANKKINLLIDNFSKGVDDLKTIEDNLSKLLISIFDDIDKNNLQKFETKNLN